MINLTKRYPVIVSLIFILFLSSFFMLFNGIQSVFVSNEILKLEKQYQYNNEMHVILHINEPIDLDAFQEIFSEARIGNIYIEDMRVYFSELDYVYVPDVILVQNEPLSLPTSVGKLEAGSIIVPSAVLDNNVTNQDSLSIGDKILRITDVIESSKYPFLSSQFVMTAGDYFQVFPNTFENKDSISIRVASNKYEIYDTVSNIESLAKANLPVKNVQIYETKDKTNVFDLGISLENVLVLLFFLYALINTVIISYYWMATRRKEIVIRKAFGANNLTIITGVMKEFLTIISSAAVIALIIQIVFELIRNGSPAPDYLVMVIFALLILVATSTLITMILPTIYVKRVRPAEGVK